MKRPRAVAFDLDGTLVDSKRDIGEACNHALVAMGRAPLTLEQIASFVGDGARMLLSRALMLPQTSKQVDDALAFFRPYYEAHAAVYTRPMPGAVEAMDALADMPIALCTNKPRGATLACLAGLGWSARFAALFCGDDGPLKPDPHGLQAIARTIEIDVTAMWIVGDAEQDVLAGRAAGCWTVGVRGGFHSDARLEASKPDVIIRSLLELPALTALRP